MPAASAARNPTPAAGSPVMSARITTPEDTFPAMPAQRTSRLYDASGQVQRRRPSPLFAIGPSEPGPALRRGALVAIPVGVALLLELGLDSPTKGAIGTGALLAGFPAMDAPARARAAWQASVAPLIAIAAALGVL